MKCIGVNKNGNSCNKLVKSDKKYCHVHLNQRSNRLQSLNHLQRRLLWFVLANRCLTFLPAELIEMIWTYTCNIGCHLISKNNLCCHCNDKRPITKSYSYTVYQDGKGNKTLVTSDRTKYYCPLCR